VAAAASGGAADSAKAEITSSASRPVAQSRGVGADQLLRADALVRR
jgi:hypothetical protein